MTITRTFLRPAEQASKLEQAITITKTTVQNAVTIFLASSSELWRERQFIGNRMRMLNDVWEPKGVHIILNIWEDYHPEFTGERKQTEYDLDLVDESDLVFGLFRSVCGRYSQEEVLRAYVNAPENLHCYRLPSEADAAVRDFETSSGISIEPMADKEEVWQKMKAVVEKYVMSHCQVEAVPLVTEIEKIYLTLGEDLQAEEDVVGNMIRGVDMLAEREMGIRCRMLPLGDSGLLSASDYYMALFDSVLDDRSSKEFVAAYNGQTCHNRPSAIAPFQKKGGAVTRYDAGNVVSNLMNKAGKEFFPIEYENLDTVKLTLIVHLLRKSKVLSPGIAFTLGQDDGLFLGKQRIVETSEALGLHIEQVNEFTVNVELLELMMPAVPQLGVEARLREEIRTLLSSDGLTAGEATELVQKCTELIAFLKKNARRFYQPDYVLRMMLLRIACNDRYDEQIGYTPDSFYKEFVEYADRYSVADVVVEQMRLNIANGLARAGQEDEAMRLYGEVRRNLWHVGSVNKMMRNKHFLLYYNALAVLATIRQEDELEQWAEELETLVGQWVEEDASLAYYRCYPWAFRLDVLSVEELADEQLLAESEECWQQTIERTNRHTERLSCLEAVHGLTKSLSRYYVDRISAAGLSMETRLAFASKAKRYLDVEERLCQRLMAYNQEEARKHYAAMLHNRGFLQIKTGKPLEAISSYLHSLEIRKLLYANYPTASREDDVAETMVNIGALLLETPGRFVSNNPEVKTDARYYAETALEIYARHNDGTLYHATNEYKARLLKGTVLYYKGEDDDQKRQGLGILQDVKQWDEDNPDNHYHGTIVDELGKCGMVRGMLK